MIKLFVTTLMTLSLCIANAQSKKEQIENLTISLDSLNQVVTNENQNFNVTLDSLNQVVTNERQNLNIMLDSLTEIIANERQVFKKEINEKGLEISNLNVQTDKLSSKSASLGTQLDYKEEQLDSLTLKTTRQSAIIDSLRSLTTIIKPSNNLLFNPSSGDMKYGDSYDIENTSFEDYSEIYCSCLSAVTNVMKENKDYDKAMGSYGIDGYDRLSMSEKKTTRAKEILKYYLSPAECSTFRDPYYFDLIFKKEVLNLCENW